MKLDTRVNHRMIEIGRMARGLTQKDVADAVGISQSNFSKIEKGLLSVNEQTLAEITKALNYPIAFFYQEDLKTPLSSIYFRKRSTVPQKSLDKIFADVKLILKSVDNLLENVELKEYQKYAFDLSNGWTPQSVAIRIREYFKVPSGPLKNLIKTVEDQGIIVYFYDSAEDKFDGLTAYTDKGVPIIIVNKNKPNDRIAYTISHELGHLTMHIPCSVEPWRDVELEANKFAAEFLMPEKDCYRDLIGLSFNNLPALKAYWGTAKAMIIRRAKDLGIISESSYQYMMIELGRRNERKIETGFVELDDPLILKEIIRLLRSEANFSDDDICQSLYLNHDDFVRYFDGSKTVKVKVRALRSAI